MFFTLSYEATTGLWLDQQGKSHEPKVDDQIDVEMCDRGWMEEIRKNFDLRFIAGMAKIVKKG
jgi:hypothetical protein